MSKRIKIFSLLLVLLFELLLFSNNSYCADGSLKVSQSVSGNNITITVTSSKKLGAFTLTASGLTAIDGNSAVGAFGNNTISGASASGETTLGKFVFNVPKKDTKVTFSVSELATDINDNDLTISSITTTLKAKKQTTDTTDKNTTTNTSNDKNTTSTNTTKAPETTKTKSNNAYLSTLGVTPKEYDFSGFSKTKTSYSVTVPSDVDSLKVAYKTADSKATVKVSGNSGFEVGSNNKITVKVTAEDGKATKTYTIKVTKLATEEESQGNLIEDEGIYLTSLNIEGVSLSPEFAKDVYSYNATLSDSSLNELEVKAESNNKDAKIDISGNTNLVDGENTINIILTMEGSTVQTVYQVVVTKAAVAVADTKDVSTDNTDLMGVIKKYVGIGIGVVAFIILAIIVLIVLLIKENKKLKEDDLEEDEDLEVKEYNVYENDENEFFNNIEKDNFIESLYKQRNGDIDEEELTESEKETLEEISNQTYDIFRDKVQGQSVEYSNEDFEEENPLIERRKRRGRGKGKHSL